mmetsp:Transcript_15893/g.23898  ORF Transcript_15893/g.23898 Transcript_15893/m.23898 type:complete len:526 (-) Transcript_15893:194-1771(-)
MDIDKVITYAGILATALTVALILCQTDRVSSYILSPGRLRAKRRQEQLYIVENAIATAVLFIRKYINDGSFYDWQEERKITDLILADEQIKNLVDDIVISKTNNLSSSSVIEGKQDGATSSYIDDGGEDLDKDDRAPEETPFIIGIAKDLKLPKADEWYIHLAFPFQVENGSTNGEKKVYYGRRVQVPLGKFGRYLAATFEKEGPKGNNFCFVADASSSLGSNIIGHVVQHSQCQIPVIHEPAWMYMLAFLIQRKVLSQDEMEKVVYGLCRLSAQAVEHKVGERYKTIVFTLPGQGCTAALLPYLQRVFPCDRHVFAYDGCVSSVKRALRLIEQSGNNYQDKGKRKGMIIPTIYSTDASSMPRSNSSSIPIKPLSSKELTHHLASLSFNEASIVESWMSSVSTFLSLKKEEQNTGYVPFVCRTEFLSNYDKKQPSATSSIALKHLLEYVSGSASQMLQRNEIDAAESILLDLVVQNADEDPTTGRDLVTDLKRDTTIENCISVYKGVFDGDSNMLSDTVQPSVAE